MEAKHEKIHEIISFLQNNRLILNSHITEAYQKSYFELIPEDWFNDLMRFSYEEYLRILTHIDKVNNI